MRTTDELMEAASAGAAFFDTLNPNWHMKVNDRTLDMGSSERCVVAQFTGRTYTGGVGQLGIETLEEALRLGLTAPYLQEYRHLTMAWRAEIRGRRSWVQKIKARYT